MSVPIVCHPLSWYVGKLERGKPFTSLLYGDGEFMVADGQHIGQTLAFGEVVTEQLSREMRASLTVVGDDIIRGTDPNLINYMDYGGRDIDSFRPVGKRVNALLAKVAPNLDWVDGVMWDVASREGKLGPLLRVLRKRLTVFVGNVKLLPFTEEYLGWGTAVPDENAAKWLDGFESMLVQWSGENVHHPVFVLCMGLGAIPLAMRLRKSVPGCTVLDLGSIFDVFAGIGEQRGWRAEMYADPVAWQECIRKNLEGLT